MDEYNKVKYDDMVNYLKEHVDTLKDMVSEVNSWNGGLDNYNWYDNNEWFYDDFFSSKDEVARAVYYGGNDYCYTDDYVRLDVYGNLETTNEWQIEEDLKDGAEEILDAFLEEYADDNVGMWDETFKGMISDYYNTEESEEDK